MDYTGSCLKDKKVMPRKSAGILLYRTSNGVLEVFLIHPGGPFWEGRETGAWSIPKGEYTSEDPLVAAIREFEEETGFTIEGDHFIPLTMIQQKGGKVVMAWAIEGNIDASLIRSNTFRKEWPPKSGKWQSFPEVDKAAWLDLPTASKLINPAQVALLEELEKKVKIGSFNKFDG
jgi:predicted NUDIX family NTP pyrophosphohydrolase